MEIHGKIAIVTGAGAGLGRAIALELAGARAAVVAADIDAAGGGETVRRIEALGGQATFVHADVTVEPDVRALVAFAEDSFGGLDVVVNNAGAAPAPHFPEARADHWGRTLDLNLRGPMLVIQHALPLLQRGGGAIVNIASLAGVGHGPNDACEYAAAKAGLIRLTVTLAPLVLPRGVRVNCIAPDWIATENTIAYAQTLPAEERARVPAVMIPPEEIAAAAARLIRDDALSGRLLVCWCDKPWGLVPEGDPGYMELRPV